MGRGEDWAAAIPGRVEDGSCAYQEWGAGLQACRADQLQGTQGPVQVTACSQEGRFAYQAGRQVDQNEKGQDVRHVTRKTAKTRIKRIRLGPFQNFCGKAHCLIRDGQRARYRREQLD